MKYTIYVGTSIFTALVFQVCMSNVESYHLKCPSQANWKIRAKIRCNSTLQYFCLYNNVEKTYVEGCEGPDWDRKGSKRIFSGSFTRGNCSQNRYQPFKFKTKESMSDCIYAKSICNEEGQVAYKGNSTREDRTCQCDNTKNYTFIKTPKNICYCNPSEEDCTCYVRSCRVNYAPSTDYVCMQRTNQVTRSGRENNRRYETVEVKRLVKMKSSLLFNTKLKLGPRSIAAAAVFILFGLLPVVGGLSFVVKKPTSKKTNRSTIQRKNSDTPSINEVNFLRMIHLLFRVACPVLQMKLYVEIKPNQLRKTLDDKRFEIETTYRKKETIIDDYQWGLLYNPVKGDKVKSEEFDIRLTIYLLCSLAKIKIVNVYPDPADGSDGAMLSRIKYIRSKATRRFDGGITEDKFKQYWNDMRQAVQTLVCKLHIENDKENTRLIENLKEKSLLIPEGHHLHNSYYDFTELTTEENNFLVVFYVLGKMVYPVIKNEFNIKCPELRFDETVMDSCRTKFWKYEHTIEMQDLNLTKENPQHYSEKKKESRNFDLRWMISILKTKAEKDGKKDSIEQLDVIDDIHREIVQSSSGMLNEERLHDILKRTREAVLHLGGTWSEEQILRLQQTKIF